MVVQRSYGSEIYNMIAGVGNSFADARQTARANSIADRSYARQLQLDELNQKRWEQEQAFERERYEEGQAFEREKFDWEVEKDRTGIGQTEDWSLTPQFYDTGGKGNPDDFVPAYTSKNGTLTIGGDTTPYDLSGAAKDGSGKKLDMRRILTLGEKELVKAKNTAIGKGQGEGELALPKQIERIERNVNAIDAVLADPNLDTHVGPIRGALPSVTPEHVDLDADLEFILSNTFLEGFDSIRGAGAITEREGAAAEAAQSRLRNKRMTPAKYRAELANYKQHLRRMGELYTAIVNGEIDPNTGKPLNADPSLVEPPAGGAPAPAAAPVDAGGAPAPAAPAGAAPSGGVTYRLKPGADPKLRSSYIEEPAGAAPATTAPAPARAGATTSTPGEGRADVATPGSPAGGPPAAVDPLITPIPNSPPRRPVAAPPAAAGAVPPAPAPGGSRFDEVKQNALKNRYAELYRRASQIEATRGEEAARLWFAQEEEKLLRSMGLEVPR